MAGKERHNDLSCGPTITELLADWKFRFFLFLAVVNLIPIWIVTYVPGADLPNHVLAALLHSVPATDSRLEYLSTHWLPSPYSLFIIVMLPLLKLFGYITSLKIVLSLAIVGIPLSVFFFMRVFNPLHWEWAFLSYLFIFTFHFEYGFIPYILGMPLVFCGLALLNRLTETNPPGTVKLSALVVVTLVYLSHVINIIALVVAAIALVLCAHNKPDGSFSPRTNRTMVIGRFFVTFFPALVLSIVMLVRLPDSGATLVSALDAMEYRSVYHQLQGPIRVFFSINPRLDLAITAAAFGLIAILILLKKAKISKRLLTILGATYFFLMLVMPRVHFLGGTDLSSRLAVFGFLSLLGSLTLETRAARCALVIVMAVTTLANVAFRVGYYSRTSRMTEEYIRDTRDLIPSGRKVLTSYCGFPSAKIKPLLHAISWYHMEKGGVSPFLLFENPAATGIRQTISLPALSEEWSDHDTLTIDSVLPRWDYLVVTTCGSPLPAVLSALPDSMVLQDSICTIWKLTGRKDN